MKIQTIIGGSIGTNCYLLERNSNVILFDFVPEVQNYIKNNNYKLDKIFLTHIHFDHIENLSSFQKECTFELYLSSDGYKNINNPEYNLLSFIPESSNLQIEDINLTNCKILKNGDEIIWEKSKIIAFESPGHSKDSMMYILPEIKSIISGDSIFYRSVGRTDFFGSNHKDLVNSINRLFAKINENYALYPGHGPSTTIFQEKEENPFLN